MGRGAALQTGSVNAAPRSKRLPRKPILSGQMPDISNVQGAGLAGDRGAGSPPASCIRSPARPAPTHAVRVPSLVPAGHLLRVQAADLEGRAAGAAGLHRELDLQP